MRLPRLLVVTHLAPPAHGGIERFLDDLTASWVRAGGAAVAVAPAGSKFSAAPVVPGSMFPWRRIRPSYAPLLWRLPRWRRGAQADVVLFGHASNALAVAGVLHLLVRFPYAVLVHGMDLRRLPGALARFALGRASVVFANSRATAAAVQDRIGRDARTVLLTPGTELPPASMARDPFHGLFVGRLVARKGLDTLLSALAVARRSFPAAHLTVVGDGPERKRLASRVADEGLSGAVRFTGAVPDGEIRALRAAAGWFCLVPEPTEDASDTEGFGIALLEAQAAGLPVITADSGGVSDAVAPGGALRVRPGDALALSRAIVRLCRDPGYANRLGAAGRTFAATHGRWSDRVRTVAAALGSDLSEFGTIGVVVPAYNASPTLGRTLASLRRQRGVRTEIVVVDDGSTDDTAAVAEPQGVRVLRQPNAGAPAARNRGAAALRTDFFFFCDADVTLAPTALRELLRGLLTHPEAAYSYSSFRFGVRTHRCGPFDANRLRRLNYISTMSLIRRADFPGFDETLNRLQDWDLWLTLLSRGKPGIWVPRYLFSATPRGSGISGWLGAPPPEAAVAVVRAKHRLRV